MTEKMSLAKRFCFYLIIAIVAVPKIPPVLASPARDARQGIQATLMRRNQARQRRDLNAYMATFTPDWTVMNVSGRVVNYSALRKSTAANFARALNQSASHTQSAIISVVLKEQIAQITVDTRYNYPVKKTPRGPVYCYKSTVASEIWVRVSAGWQEQHEQYLLDDIQYSVKPMDISR